MIVPSEGTSVFLSLTAVMTTVNAILSEIAATDAEHVLASLNECDDAWRRLDLMEDQPTRG